jgi:non-heme chloroperoxidase
MNSLRVLSLLTMTLLPGIALAAEPSSRSVHFATGDGVRLHYLETGSGPTIVFVPGWMVPGWIWEPQIRHFSRAYRVVALDPRSQGESEQATEGHYPERRAQDVRELLAHLRSPPVLLVGHSMAVGELLSYVEQFGTDGIAGLVLVDSTLGPDPKPGEAAEFFALAGAIARDRRGFIEQNWSYFFRKPVGTEYRQRLVEDLLRVPTTTSLALLVGSAGRDFRPALARIDKPVLYAITPGFKEDAEGLRSRVREARIEVFENSAHALFMDEPERFNRVLEEFARTAFARPR